jgi:hypothetical protein
VEAADVRTGGDVLGGDLQVCDRSAQEPAAEFVAQRAASQADDEKRPKGQQDDQNLRVAQQLKSLLRMPGIGQG